MPLVIINIISKTICNVTQIIRPPNIVCLKALTNAAILFFYLNLPLGDRGETAHIYHRFSRRWNFIIIPRQLPHPSLNFYRESKSAKFVLAFRHHSTLSHTHFKLEQDICNLKQTWWASMMALCPLQVWWSSLCAPQRTIRGFGPSLKLDGKNGLNQQKFH